MHKERLLLCLSVLLMMHAGHCQYFQHAFGPMMTSGEYQIGPVCLQSDGSFSARGYVDGTPSLLRIDPSGTPTAAWKLTASGLGDRRITALGATTGTSTIVALFDTITSIAPGSSRRYFGLARLSETGAVLWSARHYLDVPVDLIVPSDPQHLTVAPDGGFFMDGGEPSRPTIMRLGPDGTLLWARQLADAAEVGRICELLSDGSGGCYFLAGAVTYPDTARIVIGHFNAAGTLDMDRVISPVTGTRFYIPQHLIRRQNGNLLLTSMEHGAGEPGVGALLELTTTGDIVSIRNYIEDQWTSLTIYNTLERSDGHLFMDFQQGGYGFAELDADGEVFQVDRFRYQALGNSLGVVEWQQTLMRDDRLAVAGDYFIDVYQSTNDPSTDLLWSLNAFDPGFCPTDSITILMEEIPPGDVKITSGLTAATADIGTGSLVLISTAVALPEVLSFCDLLVGLEESPPTMGLGVVPTLVAAGSSFEVNAPEPVGLSILDAVGRVVQRSDPGNRASVLNVCTTGWSLGVYTVRAVNAGGYRWALRAW